jgi:hypothetical protein
MMMVVFAYMYILCTTLNFNHFPILTQSPQLSHEFNYKNMAKFQYIFIEERIMKISCIKYMKVSIQYLKLVKVPRSRLYSVKRQLATAVQLPISPVQSSCQSFYQSATGL